MKKRLFVSLMIAAVMFCGCDGTEGTHDPVDPDVADVPVLPKDPQPDNTSFRHRIMLLQHTGTYCPNCPRLMASLKELAEDKSYSALYHHVAAHSYNEIGDAAYSEAAAKLSQAFCSGYYPELTFNLTKENTGTSVAVEVIKEKIDNLCKDNAVVGISAAAGLKDGVLTVNTSIKTAVESSYRISVWLLEDNISSIQEGATEDWQHIHNNAVRAMAGETLNNRIYGAKIGDMAAGSSMSKVFTLDFHGDWKVENCKVMILVNASDGSGRYDLVNCAVCPVGGSIEYDYN